MMLKIIGKNCQDFRVNIGKIQSDVSRETNYSIENISAFENGRNDNCRILMWYILNGMTSEDLRKWLINE